MPTLFQYSGAVSAGAIAVSDFRAAIISGAHHSRLDRWIADGHNAGMAYMANHRHIRLDPALLLPGAQTLISLAFSYDHTLPTHQPINSSTHQLIARYALSGNDYHHILRQKIETAISPLRDSLGGEWRICVDSAPLFERAAAVLCGTGYRCDNGLIAVPGHGTRILLAEILTSLPLHDLNSQFPIPNSQFPQKECLHCGACRRACPTGALQPDGTVDARKCLSYLTIEHKGELPPPSILNSEVSVPASTESAHLFAAQGASALCAASCTLFGCDACQDCCPLNTPAFKAGEEAHPLPPLPELAPSSGMLSLTPADFLTMTPGEFKRRFRLSPLFRTGLKSLRRNALLFSEKTVQLP